MTGTVKYWNHIAQFGMIVDERGRTYLAPTDAIAMDEVGRQCLFQGESVSFEPYEVNGRSKARAVTYDAREIESDYHEECVVRKIGHGKGSFFGWLVRPCGGCLYFHSSDIITTGEETLQVGSKVWCRVKPNVKPMAVAWTAYEIEILVPEGVSHE